MSIAAFIQKPKNVFPGDLYTPIATEKFFEKYWIPAIQVLDLQWIRVFSVGLDLTKEKLPNVISELNQLKKWAKGKLNSEEQKHLLDRVSNLESMLEKAFTIEDAVVFIG